MGAATAIGGAGGGGVVGGGLGGGEDGGLSRGGGGGALGGGGDGDERSVEALRRAAAFLGIAVANLTIFFAPQRIVVGGGVAAAGPFLFDPLRAEVERRARRVAPLDAIEIVLATLGADAGAVGAALAAAKPTQEGLTK